MLRKMQAGKFKAKCLGVMDIVNQTKQPIVITKRNVPIAKLVPIEEKEMHYYGKMKGTIHLKGDIIAPIDEEWDAAN